MSLLTNIVSYWKLDGNSNDSAGSNNGTDTAITYNTSNGKINQGAGFNGTTSMIVGATVNLSSVTITCWMKSNTNPGASGAIIFGFINGTSVQTAFVLQQTGKVTLNAKDSNGVLGQQSSGSALTDGNWHFLVGTNDGTNIQLYVDNVSQGTTTPGFTGNFNGPPMEMGSNGSSLFYTGDVDECGYWSRILDTQEIQILYNGGAGVQYPFFLGQSRVGLMGIG